MRRILVIANQTLGAPELRSAIDDLRLDGAEEFLVAVPMTKSIDIVHVDQYGIPVPCGDFGDAGAESEVLRAQHRLDSLLKTIRASGAAADGVLGDADPWQTFKAIDANRFDAVVVSTLDPTLSRWLRMDLPSRIERAFDGPVHRVTAATDRPA